MIEEIIRELSENECVDAIALGGSRGAGRGDAKSDYDVYVYGETPVPEEVRSAIFEKYCSHFEVGNHFFEYEDNCIMNDGVPMDIIYRPLDKFAEHLEMLTKEYKAMNDYSTCFWFNLINSEILYDPKGKYEALQKEFTIPYPDGLKKSIIDRGMRLLCDDLPAFDAQIMKAVKRGDIVSINHRVTEFVAVYFNIIFALNEKLHPGEKRLIEIAKAECPILPADFEENLRTLFGDMFTSPDRIERDLGRIISELKRTLTENGLFAAEGT